MKTPVLTLVSATALLALSACGEGAADTSDDTIGTAEESAATDAATDAASDAMAVGEAVNAESNGDRILISEDGVRADIADGDTSIRADISDNPSLEIETD